ncbi:MAG: hypothetical protein HOO99_07140 [Hyphomicrobiaceae bacterium]|nr:hypothetical protein [Hyphomicrobiaceae bacterium]
MLDEIDYDSGSEVKTSSSSAGKFDAFLAALGVTDERGHSICFELRRFGSSPFNPDNEVRWPSWVKHRAMAADKLRKAKRRYGERSGSCENVDACQRELDRVIARACRLHGVAQCFTIREAAALNRFRKMRSVQRNADLSKVAKWAWNSGRQIQCPPRKKPSSKYHGRARRWNMRSDDRTGSRNQTFHTETLLEVVESRDGTIAAIKTTDWERLAEPKTIRRRQRTKIVCEGRWLSTYECDLLVYGRSSAKGGEVENFQALRDKLKEAEATFFASHPELRDSEFPNKADHWNSEPPDCKTVRGIYVPSIVRLRGVQTGEGRYNSFEGVKHPSEMHECKKATDVRHEVTGDNKYWTMKSWAERFCALKSPIADAHNLHHAEHVQRFRKMELAPIFEQFIGFLRWIDWGA